MGPAALAWVSVGLSAVGAATAAYSSIQQGRYQAALGKRQAEMQNMMAADAYQRGAIKANQQRENLARLTAQQETLYAKSGLELTAGSPSSVVVDTVGLGELDAQMIENDAAREAWGYKSQAQLYLARGQMAQDAGYMNAVGSVLAGAGTVVNQGADYKLWKIGKA